MRENSASEINRHLLLGDLEAQRNCEEKGEELGSATGLCLGEKLKQIV